MGSIGCVAGAEDCQTAVAISVTVHMSPFSAHSWSTLDCVQQLGRPAYHGTSDGW